MDFYYKILNKELQVENTTPTFHYPSHSYIPLPTPYTYLPLPFPTPTCPYPPPPTTNHPHPYLPLPIPTHPYPYIPLTTPTPTYHYPSLPLLTPTPPPPFFKAKEHRSIGPIFTFCTLWNTCQRYLAHHRLTHAQTLIHAHT